VRRDGGQDQYCAVFVSRGCRYQVTVSFRLPPLQPSPVSWTIKQPHACVRGGRVMGCLNALCSPCVMRSVNSWWTCSDARNIGRYNSSRYDSIRYTQYRCRYDTDPIIVCSLVVIHVTTLLHGLRGGDIKRQTRAAYGWLVVGQSVGTDLAYSL